ncbi:hypothetical protein Tco_0981416 [Tanacetum coccineum]
MYCWETATYGRTWYDDDIHDLRSVETEFPAIVFNDELTSEEALSCEPMVSSLNNNKIDFRMSFDESDDEDYMVIFDKNSFSYKIFFVDDLKTDSDNDNDKVNMPSFPSPEPAISYFSDLNFLRNFEKEFLAIAYNDSLTSKLDFLTKPIVSPQHIDEYDLKNEISLSEYMDVPPKDQRHPYLRFEGLEYTDVDIVDFQMRLGKIYGREVHRVLVLDFEGLPGEMAKGVTSRMFGEAILDIDAIDTLWFQLGGAKRRMSWRQLILALGLHTAEEMQTAGFGLYCTKSSRQISENRDLSAYWKGPDAAVGALVDAEGAHDVDKGAQAIPAPAQAPQPPPAAGPARTMTQRLGRLEEDVHGIRGALGEQIEVLDSMACDFSRFTTWMITSLSLMMDFARDRCTSYSDF